VKKVSDNLNADVILDLPTGAHHLSLALLPSIKRLVYVLRPNRTDIALAIQALYDRRLPTWIVWSQVSSSDSNYENSLNLLPGPLPMAGTIAYHPGVKESHNRQQTLAEAAEHGVLLGGVPNQVRQVAAVLYPELASSPSAAPTARRRFLPSIELVDG